MYIYLEWFIIARMHGVSKMQQLAVAEPRVRDVGVEQLGLRKRHDAYGQLLPAAAAAVVPLHNIGQREWFHLAVFVFLLFNDARYNVIKDIALVLLLFFLRLCFTTLWRRPDEQFP